MFDIITSTERQDLFQILCREVTGCRMCPRPAHRQPALSRANGTLLPKVVFVGEAPGRLGAARSLLPLVGDQSGIRFDELLGSVDLSRDEVFVTNAALCCPADDSRDCAPSGEQLRNCLRFLSETLTLLRPPVVATLGAVALRAVSRLIERPLVLAEVAGTVIECDDFLLVPLYHPSPRVADSTRSAAQQKADFAVLRDAIEWTTMAGV